MNTPILTSSFDLLEDSCLQVKAASIISAMKDNPNFPRATNSINDLSAILSEYAKEQDILHKNIKRERLVRILQNLAGYVSYTAEGNREILKSSGFDVIMEQQVAMGIGKPENLQVTKGKNPGELQLNVSRVVGAIFYNFQYTTDSVHPNSLWVSHIDFVNKFTLKNLETGRKYWCRVGVVGKDDRMVFSDIVEGVAE